MNLSDDFSTVDLSDEQAAVLAAEADARWDSDTTGAQDRETYRRKCNHIRQYLSDKYSPNHAKVHVARQMAIAERNRHLTAPPPERQTTRRQDFGELFDRGEQ